MDEGDKLKLCSEKFDAIVIGSGMGGLCTASILSKAGKNVLVLEQHYTAGGFTHSFKKKGYEWDVGVHYIGKVHEEDALLRKVFDYVSDGQLKWAFMGEVYDRMVFPDEIYDFKAGENDFKNELIKYFPSVSFSTIFFFRMRSLCRQECRGSITLPQISSVSE